MDHLLGASNSSIPPDARDYCFKLYSMIVLGSFDEQAPKSQEEFMQRLMNEPVAHAYFKMGESVERDRNLSIKDGGNRRTNEIIFLHEMGLLK